MTPYLALTNKSTYLTTPTSKQHGGTHGGRRRMPSEHDIKDVNNVFLNIHATSLLLVQGIESLSKTKRGGGLASGKKQVPSLKSATITNMWLRLMVQDDYLYVIGDSLGNCLWTHRCSTTLYQNLWPLIPDRSFIQLRMTTNRLHLSLRYHQQERTKSYITPYRKTWHQEM